MLGSSTIVFRFVALSISAENEGGKTFPIHGSPPSTLSHIIGEDVMDPKERGILHRRWVSDVSNHQDASAIIINNDLN